VSEKPKIDPYSYEVGYQEGGRSESANRMLADTSDPADAGMDNPPLQPDVDPETLRIWANMRADDAGRLARELIKVRAEVEKLRAEVNHYARQPIYMYAWGGGKEQ
jgi:hypothetical protein